jgi:acyl-CoA thioesterase I
MSGPRARRPPQARAARRIAAPRANARRTPGRTAALLLSGAAGYLFTARRRTRRRAAAARLERFPPGLNFTLDNPAAPRARTIRYLALGDSTVQGDGASAPTATLPYRIAEQLSAQFRRVELRNIGVSGATSRDVARDQAPQIAPFAPDLVTLSVGANDIVHFQTPAQFDRNVDRILRAVDAVPGARAVVFTAPALDTAPLVSPPLRALLGVQTRRYNARLRRVVAGHRATLVDAYDAIRARLLRDRSFFARDGYHPSDAGYALTAAAARPAVTAATRDL